ncbi:hypothetical protein MCEZE4_00455 [Burkholderiaceae bacterium]
MKNDQESRIKLAEIMLAKQAYKNGKNIIKILRDNKKFITNTSDIIEVAYDLQAGSYIEYANKNKNKINMYATELSNILQKHLTSKHSFLDVGTGELTNLSYLIKNLKQPPKNILAFDLSWSRVHKGLRFSEKHMGKSSLKLKTFVGDIKEIPLLNKSINITTSNHALEPNRENLTELIGELFRVTADKLILFEPCYEIATNAGKRRMDKLGYIKNITGVVEKLNGKILEKITINNSINPLNPTACFIIEPPKSTKNSDYLNLKKDKIFSVPGTNFSVSKIDNFYFSKEAGLCYPILKSIPIFKSSCAILASHFKN